MTLDDYQHEAARTLARPQPIPQSLDRAVMALGLAGEAGEVAELLKKNLGHGKPLAMDALTSELGDCLWYLAAIATQHGLTLDEVAAYNVAKLRARYPAGFREGGGNR